jgi:hypothetical protein
MNYPEPKTSTEALTLALTLAVTAATEAQAKECLQYAEQIASTMNSKEVMLCKAAAECALEYEKQYGKGLVQ